MKCDLCRTEARTFLILFSTGCTRAELVFLLDQYFATVPHIRQMFNDITPGSVFAISEAERLSLSHVTEARAWTSTTKQ